MKRAFPVLIVTWLLMTWLLPLPASEPAAKPERTPHDRVYFFQHRLLPGWTHDSEGAFFNALNSGQYERMIGAARDIVSEEFTQQIEVKCFAESSSVLLTFAPPKEPPECFFVLVVKEGDGFRFFTLELTEDILDLGLKSVVGEWTADHKHRNLGSRNYVDAASFMAELTKKKVEGL